MKDIYYLIQSKENEGDWYDRTYQTINLETIREIEKIILLDEPFCRHRIIKRKITSIDRVVK